MSHEKALHAAINQLVITYNTRPSTHPLSHYQEKISAAVTQYVRASGGGITEKNVALVFKMIFDVDGFNTSAFSANKYSLSQIIEGRVEAVEARSKIQEKLRNPVIWLFLAEVGDAIRCPLGNTAWIKPSELSEPSSAAGSGGPGLPLGVLPFVGAPPRSFADALLSTADAVTAASDRSTAFQAQTLAGMAQARTATEMMHDLNLAARQRNDFGKLMLSKEADGYVQDATRHSNDDMAARITHVGHRADLAATHARAVGVLATEAAGLEAAMARIARVEATGAGFAAPSLASNPHGLYAVPSAPAASAATYGAASIAPSADQVDSGNPIAFKK